MSSSKKKSKKKEVFKNTLVLREDLIYLIEQQAIEFNDKSSEKWLKDLRKSTQKYIKIDLSEEIDFINVVFKPLSKYQTSSNIKILCNLN